MDRRKGLERSPMPPRTASLARSARLSAKTPGTRPDRRLSGIRPSGEFSGRVRLLVRIRAGAGDAFEAQCESCGIWLGRHGGQIQHIVARGMGGTSDPVLRTAVNAALLCGTPDDKTTCHGLAESRDPGMRERGFWLPQGSGPRIEPMRLHSPHGSGVLVWRSEDGRYLYSPPEGVAAA